MTGNIPKSVAFALTDSPQSANDARNSAFCKYLSRKNIVANEEVADIFFMKCLFLYLKRINKNTTLEKIYNSVGSFSLFDSFDIKKCSTSFNGFLHFVAFCIESSNCVKNSNRVNNLIEEWKKDGRSCEEINEQGLTVFDVALKVNNLVFIRNCIEKYELNLAAIGDFGFSESYTTMVSDIFTIQDYAILKRLDHLSLSSLGDMLQPDDVSHDNAFNKYLLRKNIISNEEVEDLFLLKCCFIQLKGISKASTLQMVYDLVSVTTIIDNFYTEQNPTAFSGFLHFIAARIKAPDRISNIITE